MTNPFIRLTDEPGSDAEPLPEEGGFQSGTQIDESEIDQPFDDHSPSTENDVT